MFPFAFSGFFIIGLVFHRVYQESRASVCPVVPTFVFQALLPLLNYIKRAGLLQAQMLVD